MALNPYQQALSDAGGNAAGPETNPVAAGAAIADIIDDDGNLRESVPEETPPESPEPPEEETSASEEQTTASEDETSAEEEEEPPEGEVTQAETDEEEGEVSFNTVEELAGALEMSKEDFLSTVKLSIKAAGTEHEATLADLVTGYQLKADYDRDKTALSAERRKASAEHQKRVEAIQRQATVQDAYFQQAEQGLHQSINTPEMQQLRMDDPAEYAIKLQEQQQALSSFHNFRNEMAQRYEAWREDQFNQHVAAEADKLYSGGDWSDDKTQEAAELISSLGYDESEMKNFVDARLIRGAYEFSQLRSRVKELEAQLGQQAAAARKVKRTVPKLVKPRAQKTKLSASEKRIQTLRNRLKKSQDHRSAGDLIAAQLVEN